MNLLKIKKKNVKKKIVRKVVKKKFKNKLFIKIDLIIIFYYSINELFRKKRIFNL